LLLLTVACRVPGAASGDPEDAGDKRSDAKAVVTGAMPAEGGRVLTCPVAQEALDQRPKLEQWCEEGRREPCFELGEMYRDGVGVDQDEAEARRRFARACTLGDPRGCFEQGMLTAPGTTGEGSRDELVGRACGGDVGEACLAMALANWTVRTVSRTEDRTTAPEWLRRACDRGDDRGCAMLGWIYQTGIGEIRDREDAQMYFFRGQSMVDFGSCEEYSARYISGPRSGGSGCHGGMHGCPKGCKAECEREGTRMTARLIEPLERACEAENDGLACFLTGKLYDNGMPFEGLGEFLLSDDEAEYERLRALTRSYYEKACSRGLDVGCAAYALDMLWGTDDDEEQPLDPRVATLLDETCAARLPKSCLEAGKLWESGRGRPRKDAKLALQRYEEACELGMKAVCRDLSRMYETGDLAPKNSKRAKEFAEKSRPW